MRPCDSAAHAKEFFPGETPLNFAVCFLFFVNTAPCDDSRFSVCGSRGRGCCIGDDEVEGTSSVFIRDKDVGAAFAILPEFPDHECYHDNTILLPAAPVLLALRLS